MKVMQINSVCGIRSTGKICTDLEEVLRRKGHESRILYGRETAPEIYDSISRRITSPNEIRVHAFLSRCNFSYRIQIKATSNPYNSLNPLTWSESP